MKAELEAIKDAWDKETGQGRDDHTTRRLVDEYVAAHPEEFEEFEAMGTARLNNSDNCPNCNVAAGEEHVCPVVTALSAFRAAGMERMQWLAEIWLIHHFEPQQIGGPLRARVRLPGRGE